MPPGRDTFTLRRHGPVASMLQRQGHVALVLLLAWLLAACSAAGPGTIRIDQAWSVASSQAVLPMEASGRIVRLPDDWAHSRPSGQGPVWYRVGFRVDGPAPGARLRVLYIDKVCSSLEVHLNGRLLHRAGRSDGAASHLCHQPQLVTLPSALLQPGDNQIDLKVDGHPLAQTSSRHRAGHLSALQIGWQDELAELHALRSTLAGTVPQALAATLLLMGGFLFVLGFAHRRESHLAYFGALSVGWALVEGQTWLRLLPVSHTVAEFLGAALAPLITLVAVQFLLRMGQDRIGWVQNALWLQCALMPLSLVLAGPGRLYPLTVAWHAVFALQLLLAGAHYLRSEWPQRQRSYWWMAAGLAVALVYGLIEWATQIMGERPLAAQLAQLSMPVLLVLTGLRLVQQHGRALMVAEAGRAHLEQRVREATAEIEKNFRQLSELRVEQVTERERKRIAADLHDDLGAKLLTIVHTSESERISTLAREALEEMRLSVRGLTGKPVLLLDALGDWRVEVMLRLNQAGIECEWFAPDGDELPQRLSARAYVQTTRILREATSNIIKHSGASRCSVNCTLAEGDFQLVIQDNGNGIAADVELRLDRGHGLASMKSRAKQLQGQCLVESAPGYGTVIRLTLPMEHATAAP